MSRLHFLLGILLVAVSGPMVSADEAPTYTLDECLRSARHSNRTIRAAELQERAQQEHRSSAKADYLPKVEARGLYYTSFSDPLQGFLNGLAERRAGLIQFGVTQPLTQLVKVHYGVRVVEAEVLSAKADRDVAHEEVANAVRQVYWKIVQLTAQQKAVDAALLFLEARLSDVRAAETAGKVLRDSLLEVESKLLETRQNSLELNSALQLAHFQMAELIGLATTDAFRVNTDIKSDRFGADQSVDHLERLALERRGEVRKAEADTLKAEAALGLAKSAYLPDLALTVAEIRQEGYQFVPVNNHGAGLLFNWTLYDFGKRKAEVRHRRLTIDAARLKLADARAKVRLEIRQALHTLHTAEEAEAAAGAQVRLEGERLRIATNRNQVGKATSTELLEARMRLAIAEAELTGAQCRVSLAAGELRRAAGEN